MAEWNCATTSGTEKAVNPMRISRERKTVPYGSSALWLGKTRVQIPPGQFREGDVMVSFGVWDAGTEVQFLPFPLSREHGRSGPNATAGRSRLVSGGPKKGPVGFKSLPGEFRVGVVGLSLWDVTPQTRVPNPAPGLSGCVSRWAACFGKVRTQARPERETTYQCDNTGYQ